MRPVYVANVVALRRDLHEMGSRDVQQGNHAFRRLAKFIRRDEGKGLERRLRMVVDEPMFDAGRASLLRRILSRCNGPRSDSWMWQRVLRRQPTLLTDVAFSIAQLSLLECIFQATRSQEAVRRARERCAAFEAAADGEAAPEGGSEPSEASEAPRKRDRDDDSGEAAVAGPAPKQRAASVPGGGPRADDTDGQIDVLLCALEASRRVYALT